MLEQLLNNPIALLLTGAVTLLLLPENVVASSEALLAIREHLRRNLKQILHLTLQGPLGKLFVVLARRCCCGYLSSTCQPPYSFKAQAVSESDLVLSWIARTPPGNPFHEELYVCAWRNASEPSSGEAPVQWNEHETPAKDYDGDDPDGHRWTVLLEHLPEGVPLRLRVRAENRHGRGEWSEEIEIEMPTEQFAVGAQRRGVKVLARSRVVGNGAPLCLQCRRPQPPSKLVAYADVVCPSVFGKDCPHGPFCARCHRTVSAQVLPSCVCRGLIGTWREALPGKPEQSEAKQEKPEPSEAEPGKPEQSEAKPGKPERPEAGAGKPERPEAEAGEPKQPEAEAGKPEQSRAEAEEPEQSREAT